ATYDEPYIVVPLPRFTLRLPNLKARRDAVRVHDLNHIVGGFGTDFEGEALIGGFELGMGAGRYWIGWLLDASALTMGLVRAPLGVLRSFARGRAAKASTFHVIPSVDSPAYEATLDSTVGEFRAALGIPDEAAVRASDVALCVAYAAAGLAVTPAIVALIVVGTAVHGVVGDAPAA
ncbi:MAG TPA: hypothetical protein VGF99_15240, partial [Myxococcota bacterium]